MILYWLHRLRMLLIEMKAFASRIAIDFLSADIVEIIRLNNKKSILLSYNGV